MLVPALLLSILYWVLSVVDTSLLGWQALTRPIVVCPLAGILLGDVKTGCILGAELESLFMGISAIGGSIAADPMTTSLIGAAFVIKANASIESAVAISMPIGTVMATVTYLPYGLFAPVQGYFSKLLQDNKVKQFEVTVFLLTIVQTLLSAIVLFICIYFGVEGIQAAIAAAPAWVMTGLGAVSSMALAVGFAILLSQIVSGKTIMWFFVGYVLVKYLKLDTLAVAIIGTAVASTIFFIEKMIVEKSASTQVQDSQEDFF
ncbi:MAG: PTS sugar transporter subunit IIC [Erysipelotrichia bacterium]|nr:PTS sugar transporter subunit IIC [Erysipelotrichia bacterium]